MGTVWFAKLLQNADAKTRHHRSLLRRIDLHLPEVADGRGKGECTLTPHIADGTAVHELFLLQHALHALPAKRRHIPRR